MSKNNLKNDLKNKLKIKQKQLGEIFRFHYVKSNTITSTIFVAMFVFIAIVEFIIYIYANDSLKQIQNKVSADMISSMDVYRATVRFQRWPELKDNLNNVLSGEITVKDVIVLDKNKKELYSSLVNKERYVFPNPQNPSFIKVTPAKIYKHYRVVYMPNEAYFIYLILPKADNMFMEQIKNFLYTFFLIIIALSVCFSHLLSKSIRKPLSQMEKQISKIADGDLSGRLDYTNYYEINKLVQAYNTMTDVLQRLYSSLEAQVQDRTKELKGAYAELQNTQAMMLHSEKMKSLGELVAGIMHEINNPINFIYGNMVHLNNYSQDLMSIIDEYSKLDETLKEEDKNAVVSLKQDIDYEFLKSDLPDLIKSCKEGADRAKNIIQDLKSFSRMEEVAITDVDLVHEIDMTLNILHNKLKNKATIHKEFMENMPMIEAFGGQLNQVFMNILDNAAGAIDEKGDIWIRINTDDANEKLLIEIQDNGSGMDEETARKIFNPFFTTKPVGKGTGLGLSITYKIIKNHQGDIKVESAVGQGTKFIITLPIKLNREIMSVAVGNEENNGQV